MDSFLFSNALATP